MGPRPLGRTIDRIDATKGYEPSNCRWATPKEQVENMIAAGGHYEMNRTQCPQGHEYSITNTTWWNKKRKCRTCHAARERMRRKKHGK